MIIIEPCAGLGNRFIALTCAYHLSKTLNKKLTVIWKKETVLGAAMKDLLELPEGVDVIEVKEFGYKNDLFAQIHCNNIMKKYRKMSDAFFECDDIMNLYDNKGQDGIVEMVSKTKCVYIKATNPFFDIYDIDNAFSFIRPTVEISDKSRKILENIEREHLVGVHIRRTDHIESIKNSPLSLFIDKMNEELKKDEMTHFYVASDDVSVERELKEIFGDRIYTFEGKTLDRDSIEGIKDAYVEMLNLSSGRKILGSFNSTFSLMASKMGNIPLCVVKN